MIVSLITQLSSLKQACSPSEDLVGEQSKIKQLEPVYFVLIFALAISLSNS